MVTAAPAGQVISGRVISGQIISSVVISVGSGTALSPCASACPGDAATKSPTAGPRARNIRYISFPFGPFRLQSRGSLLIGALMIHRKPSLGRFYERDEIIDAEFGGGEGCHQPG